MPNSPAPDAVFAAALDFNEPEARSRYLQEACAEFPAVRAEVESLLAAHHHATRFMTTQGGTLLLSLPHQSFSAVNALPNITGFRIERTLGAGGLGTVYEAWDEKLQRKVALKVLHSASDPTTGKRMLDEARKIAALRHPSVVTVHAVLDEHQPPAIVMELVEGFPVDRFSTSLSMEQKARILQEIASALTAAHRSGIIHRDLKPANILLTPAMRPVVLDFGLAISTEEVGELTTRFVGTPLYASPEQVTGTALTEASDLFSFGSVMFKLLTGRAPFEGETSDEVFRSIQQATPPFLRDVAADIPADLQAICLACLAAEASERPSAEEVTLDLGRFLAGEPVRLRPALYGDILRRRISEYSNDLLNWEHQGIISMDERDRLEVVHRRILADEDHWLVDARRLTLAQAILYTSTWVVVLASGYAVWMVREDLSVFWRTALPLLSTGVLVAVGLLAERRRDVLASAAFLAGAVLSLVPATLTLLVDCDALTSTPPGVKSLFEKTLTNAQVLTACLTALALSIVALRRLRLTGFAWTSCLLAVLSYLSLLLQWNWLGKDAEIMALWTLPLASFVGVGLGFEKLGRVRWAFPFHLVAALTICVAFDVIAANGPTLTLLGLKEGKDTWFDHARLEFLSYALNGVAFLGIMFITESARSLDLRRGSRVFEIAAILHLLGGLYQNAQSHRHDAHVWVDVGLYLSAVGLFLILGPLRSRWRMLMGALSGVALGSYLLLDLELVARKPFVIGLGITGLLVALSAYLYLLKPSQPSQRSRSEVTRDRV